MKIYRIENSEGRGVFCHSNRIATLIQRMVIEEVSPLGKKYTCVHPVPSMDSRLQYQMKVKDHCMYYMVFGFSSINQLKMWFSSDKVKQFIHDQGFQVSVYDIPPKLYSKGDTQVVFYRDEHDSPIKVFDIIDI